MFGPEFAMLRTPRPVWDRLGRNSSLKGFPQNDSPPGSWKKKEEKIQRERQRRGESESMRKRVSILNKFILCGYHWILLIDISTPTKTVSSFKFQEHLCWEVTVPVELNQVVTQWEWCSNGVFFPGSADIMGFCRWSSNICSDYRTFSHRERQVKAGRAHQNGIYSGKNSK